MHMMHLLNCYCSAIKPTSTQPSTALRLVCQVILFLLQNCVSISPDPHIPVVEYVRKHVTTNQFLLQNMPA